MPRGFHRHVNKNDDQLISIYSMRSFKATLFAPFPFRLGDSHILGKAVLIELCLK
jgi:hypothetical protein